MTLNPSAAVFVPSLKILHLAKTSPRSTSSPVNINNDYGGAGNSGSYSPLRSEPRQGYHPHLTPLYLNVDDIRIQQQINRQQNLALPARGNQQVDNKAPIEPGSFDTLSVTAKVKSFLEDMVHDAIEDFHNYLTFRGEYLLDYANASPECSLEIIKCIFIASHPKNAHDYLRPQRLAMLATAMVEMNARFYKQLFQKLDLVVQEYLKRLGSNPSWTHSDNFGARLCIFVGRLLNELHIGRCRDFPKQFTHFGRIMSQWLAELLQITTATDYAIVSLSQCYRELRAVTPMRDLDVLHTSLQRTSIPDNEALRQLLIDIQRIARQRDIPQREICSRMHKIQIAELNDEENEAFEQFLQNMRQDALPNSIANNDHYYQR